MKSHRAYSQWIDLYKKILAPKANGTLKNSSKEEVKRQRIIVILFLLVLSETIYIKSNKHLF